MNKLAHGLVTAAFAAACGCLWLFVTLLQNTAIEFSGNQPLPAFARLCFQFRPLLLVPPLLAAAYCLLVWVRKSDGQKSWFAFFATTIYALVLLTFPALITGWLLVVRVIELLAKR
jgi:predicted small integral membrane protein